MKKSTIVGMRFRLFCVLVYMETQLKNVTLG